MNRLETIYQKRTDSLQKELQFYRVKEDYYVDAVSNQANFFLFVFSTVLAIASLLGFGYFRIQFNDIEKRFIQRLEDANVQSAIENSSTRNVNVLILIQMAEIVERITMDDMFHYKNAKSIIFAVTAIKTYIITYQLDPIVFPPDKVQPKVESLLNMIGGSISILTNTINDESRFRNELIDIINLRVIQKDNHLEELIMALNSSKTRELFYSIKEKIKIYIPLSEERLSKLSN